MVQFSLASMRDDGATNRVVMIGNSGYLGETDVYLKYLEDGYVRLYGSNVSEQNGWKKLSELVLEPGVYTLTGMNKVPEKVIALQLRIRIGTDKYQYLYQNDEDVSFVVDRPADAVLHVMVYPNVEKIDVKARPAVYKDG